MKHLSYAGGKLKNLKFIILPLCLMFSGCIDLFGPDAPDQKYLFDVYYVNNAWGFNLHGAYIDKNGDVYSYSLNPADHVSWDSVVVLHRHGGTFKESDLCLKYSFNKKFIKNIDPALLRQKLAELYSVPLKAYSDTLYKGADMGAYVYSGFRFLEENRTYEEVELKVTGDLNYYNTSETAAELVSWLDSQLGEAKAQKLNK